MRKAPVQIREVKESKVNKSCTHIIEIRRAFPSGDKGQFRHSSNFMWLIYGPTGCRSQGNLEFICTCWVCRVSLLNKVMQMEVTAACGNLIPGNTQKVPKSVVHSPIRGLAHAQLGTKCLQGNAHDRMSFVDHLSVALAVDTLGRLIGRILWSSQVKRMRILQARNSLEQTGRKFGPTQVQTGRHNAQQRNNHDRMSFIDHLSATLSLRKTVCYGALGRLIGRILWPHTSAKCWLGNTVLHGSEIIATTQLRCTHVVQH